MSILRPLCLVLFPVLLLIGCASTPPPAKASAPELRVGGYYASNNIYAKRDYQVADIPSSKLTHVFYAFLKIDDDFTVTFYDKNADIVKKYPDDLPGLGYHGSFAQLQVQKKANPKLRVIASVGGGYMSDKFSPMAATAKTRKAFIDSAVVFVKKYGFDGLDLDWEFPVEGGQPNVVHSPDDTKNLVLLLQGLRTAFDAETAASGKAYEVGLTVTQNPGYGKNLDIPAMAPLIDFLNIMTYDYHSPGDPGTNHLAPLYPSPSDPAYKYAVGRKLSVTGAVQYYLDRGIPPRKLNLGIPLYGIGWQVAPKLKKPLYAPKVEKPTLKEIGVLDYASVQKLVAGGIHPEWDDDSHAPYLYDPETGLFVSYDDGRSVTEKVELVGEKGLGGVFFWELSQDRGGDLINFTVWTLKRAVK
ncbi:MAG TPA: glycoside hydrolase family 18 protein [Spirochaetia bacterium]|nr:glycoside hydrolase family 18 protein [Spirochaetia bacterium]